MRLSHVIYVLFHSNTINALNLMNELFPHIYPHIVRHLFPIEENLDIAPVFGDIHLSLELFDHDTWWILLHSSLFLGVCEIFPAEKCGDEKNGDEK